MLNPHKSRTDTVP